MRRNQNLRAFRRESDLRLPTFRFFNFLIFFHLSLSPFLFFLLQWLTFYWACFQFKKFWESIIETDSFYHRVATWTGRKFVPVSFLLNFLSIFGHISSSIGPITLIWVSLEISFPPSAVESKLVTSEVEESLRLVTAGTGVSGLIFAPLGIDKNREI